VQPRFKLKKYLKINMEKKMKRFLSFALWVAAFIVIGVATKPLYGQVYSDFSDIRIKTDSSFAYLTGDVVINATQFMLANVNDKDDGYYNVNIGFPFEFNGVQYSSLNVCVNGFVTFSQPLFLAQNRATGLFNFISSTYQNNVIAPFWGDHYYRTNEPGYTPSTISYKLNLVGDTTFTVQWKNLNINDKTNPLSYASFQMILYKSKDPLTNQGNIEFRYGSVGSNVTVQGASIGIKGGDFQDFLNALAPTWAAARTVTTLSSIFPPTGGTDKGFYFDAFIRYKDINFWGDGDADLSKQPGGKHHVYYSDQGRYVTINDARVIMRSISQHIPLDSIRGRQSYHGDVNHDGRYFYYIVPGDLNQKMFKPVPQFEVDIPWKDINYDDNITTPWLVDVQIKSYDSTLSRYVPADSMVQVSVPSVTNIYYKVNEYDASFILHFLGARIPYLPWIIDTIPQYGRVTATDMANNISFGNPQQVGINTYKIPVTLNGYFKGPIGTKMDFDGTITNVESFDNIPVENSDNTLVIASSGEFYKDMPICYVTIKTDKQVINAQNIRFNGTEKSNININLTVNTGNDPSQIIQNYPNPVETTTNIIVNINEDDVYTLNIFNINGMLIKTLVNGNLQKGVYNFPWDGTDNAGNKLDNGIYFYRLNGANLNITNKMILDK
jgi:hypothetical protein